MQTMEGSITATAVQSNSSLNQYITTHTSTNHSFPNNRSLIELQSDQQNSHTENKYPSKKRLQSMTSIANIDQEKTKKRLKSEFKVLIDLTQNIHYCVCGKILDAGKKSRVGGSLKCADCATKHPMEGVKTQLTWDSCCICYAEWGTDEMKSQFMFTDCGHAWCKQCLDEDNAFKLESNFEESEAASRICFYCREPHGELEIAVLNQRPVETYIEIE